MNPPHARGLAAVGLGRRPCDFTMLRAIEGLFDPCGVSRNLRLQNELASQRDLHQRELLKMQGQLAILFASNLKLETQLKATRDTCKAVEVCIQEGT